MTIFTLLGLLSSILVVSTSTVFSVLWLVATFMLVSLMLALLNLGFPALIYVIVYIGAIAILFLFVIQLVASQGTTDQNLTTNEKSKSLLDTRLLNGPMNLVAFIFSVGMMSVVLAICNAYISTTNTLTLLPFNLKGTEPLFDVSEGANLHASSLTTVLAKTGISTHVESFGEWLYGPGLIPLIIVSLVLLVAMIAPIYLCKD